MKIAILDDDALVRNLIVKSLEALGHSPSAFATEEELLSEIAPLSPDLVVLDQMLGGNRTGIQLVADIRELIAGIPIVIVTGYPGAQLEKAVELNSVSILPKPFTLASLDEQIAKVVS